MLPHVRRWAAQVRSSGNGRFEFAVKAPKAITHEARLGGEAAIGGACELLRRLSALGGYSGPVLFQTPPSLARDDSRLRGLLEACAPFGARLAFEFRCPSWDSPEVDAILAGAGAARVEVVYPFDKTDPPEVRHQRQTTRMLRRSALPGAALTYIRMGHSAAAESRGEVSEFGNEQLRLLANELAVRRGQEGAPPIYVYFMNDLEARAPHNARSLCVALATASGGAPPVRGFAPLAMTAGGAVRGGGVAALFAAATKKQQTRQKDCARGANCSSPSASASQAAAGTSPSAQGQPHPQAPTPASLQGAAPSPSAATPSPGSQPHPSRSSPPGKRRATIDSFFAKRPRT